MRIADLCPTEGFLPRYVREATTLTDAPPVFHLAAATTLLGSAVADHTVVRLLDEGKVSTQRLLLWSICIGSTTDFKTYSVEKAIDLFRPLLADRIFEAGGSREGIEDLLLEIRNPVFYLPEAPQWFTANRAGYARNGRAMWCSLYDGTLRRWHFRRSDRTGEIPVSISMLGAAALDALLAPDCTRPVDWQGGLFVRILWIAGVPTRNSKATGYDWTDQQLLDLRLLIEECVGHARRNPVLVLTKQARTAYMAWSASLKRQAIGLRNPAHVLVLKRLNHHVQRIAGIFAVSRLSRYVTSDDMDRACRLGDHSKDSVLSMNLK